MFNKKIITGILFVFSVLMNNIIHAQVEIVSSGVGSAYVLNVPAIFPLRNGVQVTFKAHVVSGASPTINVTGTGPILMKKEGGTTNLAAGDIKAGQIVHLAYDGSFWQMLSLPGNPPPVSVGGSGTQNYVSKWDNPAGTVLGNSTIFDDGINVGVGTTSPFSQFHIFGMNPNLTLESSAGNFQTGYVIKTPLNQWFLGQEGTSTSGFRITDVDAGLPRFQIDQNGNIGIGTTTPMTKLHVAGDNPSSIVNQVAENTSSSIQSGILVQRSRGTVTAPSAVLAGDQIGGFYVMGYDGSAFGPNGPNAGMYAVANQNFGTGVNGTNLYFETTPNNSSSSTTRLTILENGNIGIGTETPNQKLEVQDGHILLSNSTGTQSELRFKESSFNGGNIISFKAPAFLSANVNYTLPPDQGGFNDVLTSDGTGGLFWQPASAGLSGGTLNYLPKWTSVNSLSSTSLVYDDGIHVGIGTTMTNTVGTNTRALTVSASDSYSGSKQVGLELRGSEGAANAMLGQINFVHGSGLTEMSRIETRTGSGNIIHGQLAFYTNYSDGFLERMRISDVGNVGIGISNPGEKLQVFAPTTAAISVVSGNTSRARYYLGGTANNYSGAIEYNNANNSMNFWTNNTVNRLVIDASGNVAIGNGTPTTMFSVGASSQFQVAANGNIMRINNVNTSFPFVQGAASTVLQNDGSGNLSWVSMSSNAWGLTGNSGTNPVSNFVGTTDNDFLIKGGTGASIRLNHSANTSLHTASQHVFATNTGTGPGLLVSGSGLTSSMLGIQQNAAVNLAGPLGSLTFGAAGSAVNQAEIRALREASSSGSADIPTALTFYTTSDGSSISGERMRIDNAGNVGIGVSTPASRLHSAGQIRTGIPAGGLGGAGAVTGSLLFYNTATTATVNIQSGSTTTGYTLTLPTSVATANNSSLISTTGGVLSWAAPGAAGAGLPSGTTGQTLRHDGTNWISNSFLFNTGTNIGIGTTAPAELLELSSIDSDIDAETYSTTESSSLHIKRARGTAATPSVPLSGDYFGGVGFQAWDGSVFQEGARIQGAIDGSAAATDMPGRLEFWTAPDGSATAVERMRISSTGNVGIGTTLPGSSRLNVVIPSSDALNPIGLTVTNNYTGASAKYGIDVNVDGAGSGVKYGISSSVVGLAGDASANYGYQVTMTPNGTGAAYGLNSSLSAVGTGTRYGFYNSVSSLSTNASNIFGISSTAIKPSGSSGNVTGAYLNTQNDGSGVAYGLHLNNTGTATTRYGVYVSGETGNYFSSNVGIGTTAPSSKLEVVGDVEIPAANDYTYTTAKTNYNSISPVAFIPESSTYFRSSVSGYIYLSGGTFPNTGEIHAPVNLPNGAVITEVRFYISDNDATYDFVYLQLFRYTMSSGASVFSSVTIPTGTFALSSYAATPNYVVDNSLYQYMIRVGMPQNSTNHKLYGVRITYTVTKTD